MDILIWINTLALLVGFIVGGVIVVFQLRKISEALARVEETAARGERLSLAILERLPSSRESQA
ncbi:MAG: hypothetical protein HY268_26385 [Deltaproteobacteria bacterium]|nr:hypothetical protein [Deltaproteobacteria bacterium]